MGRCKNPSPTLTRSPYRPTSLTQVRNGELTGPGCFGGVLEFCRASKFTYVSSGPSGDGRKIAVLQKLAPTSCSKFCAEVGR